MTATQELPPEERAATRCASDASAQRLAAQRRARSASPLQPRVRRHATTHTLAILVGRYPKTMGIAVIIRDKELGLAVVTFGDLRHLIADPLQALSQRVDVAGRPVEPNAFVVLRLDRQAGPLIEPEVQTLVVNHAAYEPAVLSHCSVHGQPQTLYPKTEALVEICTWDNWNARLHQHRRLLAA